MALHRNNGKLNSIFFRLLSVPVTISAILFVYFFKIPNPMMILIIPVVFFTYLDGYISGLLSGFTAVAYSAYFFYFATADISAGQKLTTILLAVSTIVVLVGKLKARDNWVISELKMTHDQLLKQKEHAEELNRSKSEFLSRMSHEIRTPMNAILGTAEIQLQKESLSPEAEEAFSTIYNSGGMLLNIINDILDLSKIEAGKLELILVNYDIPSLINDILQFNLLRYESKQIEFSLKVNENTPLMLFGDELRLKQILNNLLSNAFKYTDKGQVELSVAAEPKDDSGTILVMQVRDTGQGMTKKQMDNLFEAYTRFNMDTNRYTAGIGLGMSITKRLIELMGGEIAVESERGQGSTLTIRLPQKRVGPSVCGPEIIEKIQQSRFQSISKVRKSQFAHKDILSHASVLIVDDMELNLHVAKGMMLPYGLKIDTVKSGIEALDKISNGEVFDIVFMDHMMPKMDGLQATKKIRETGYTRPIVALTANAMAGQAEKFLANGFDGFISKPIDSRELHLLLTKFIPENS